MIIKLMTRTTKGSIRSLAKYVLSYTTDNLAKDKKKATVLVRHNLTYSNDIEGYIRAFMENEQARVYRRKNNAILQHVVISFSPLDHAKVTGAVLKKVSKKWITLTAADCLCLAVSHEKENQHAHLIISAVKTNGRSARLSQKQLSHALEEMELYQAKEFPFLTLSAISHAKKKTMKKEMQEKENGIINYKTIKETEPTINEVPDHVNPLEVLQGGYMAGKQELRAMGIEPIGATFGSADLFKIDGKPALAVSWIDGALAGMAIHPEFQGKGLGKAFIRNLTKDRPLEVCDPNEQMLGLLKSIGKVSEPDGRGVVTVTANIPHLENQKTELENEFEQIRNRKKDMENSRAL
jgi:GNAT superfamily N-acetyltransferase